MTSVAVIDNYLNGNTIDAKQGSQRHSYIRLVGVLVGVYGFDSPAANAVASYLKDQGTFQDAADAELVMWRTRQKKLKGW